MAYKINVSHKGKTYKVEIENEELVGRSIGEKIDGALINEDLAGYEIEITGTSDKSGFCGMPEVDGPNIKRILLGYGRGMKNRPRREGKKKVANLKGLRLRKTVRGKEISNFTVQINTKVLKEGKKKFDDLFKTEEAPTEGEVAPAETPKEQATETAPTEKPKEEKKE
jgi:small subunit ribosomal protein S6e